jgi:hypothetical protein
MTTTAHPTQRQRTPMTSERKSSLATGILYLLTFSSIPTLGLYAAAREPDFILGSGPASDVILGTVLELIVAFACIGTAVAIYPIIKKQNQGMALAFIGARILEASTIFAGVAVMLTLVSLRSADLGPDALITGQALITLHVWLRLGQAIMPAANAVLLGSLLFRGRLVPRILPTIGLIGAPLLLGSDIAIMFGVIGDQSSIAALCTLLIAVWELSLGIWLTVKGTRPTVAVAE